MNPLKQILITATLMSLTALPSFAGPSDGTGTNISQPENKLTDEVRYLGDHGSKQTLIDPVGLHLKSGEIPYQDIKAKMDRLGYLYPGAAESMEKVFRKTWILTNKDLGARNSSEKTVILQNDERVYVNLAWLKSAKPEQVREAFLHEAVRGIAKDMVRSYFKRDQYPDSIEDEITETISPAVYRDMPASLLRAEVDKLLKKISGRSDDYRYQGEFYPLRVLDREEVYGAIAKSSAKAAYEKMCKSLPASEEAAAALLQEKYGTEPNWFRRKDLDSQLEPLARYSPWGKQDHVQYISLGSSTEMRDTLQFLYSMAGTSAGISIYVRRCNLMRGMPRNILTDFAQDGGKIRDGMLKSEKATSIPDDDQDEAKEGSAD